jgi:hypothetical protein
MRPFRAPTLPETNSVAADNSIGYFALTFAWARSLDTLVIGPHRASLW